MTAPTKVHELVERFERNLGPYKQGKYNETQVRLEFINPLFEELGWDIANKQGYAEAYKEVVHEDAIKVGGATKAPDYSFRIGGIRKFFLEAKKPSVDIKYDIHPAYQLRRYAWSAKLPLSILTDFEELAVYDCRVKPVQTDKASHSRILYLTYADYAKRWEEIAGIFSREAILKGSFDKYVESKKGKRGTAEVDAAFLQEIERWRDLLARNIALRNPALSQRELNFSVQRTIDRIIFLRICEDRGIEYYGKLMALQNGTRIYQRLFQLFRQADDRYNSGLFHFRSEKERPDYSLDKLTPDLAIDDKVLKDILKNLYYPDSPYEFSVLPANILGQVYEQFLGKVIRLTPAHHAVVEDKPEVRKAGGVYYTPTYIVDYIVKQTVGKLVEGKKPGPRGAVSKLKILDPACGSGSFLLGAYQFLLDWHRDEYIGDGPEKWATGRNPRLYRTDTGEWKLTTDERKRILLNNIHGVDIDPQAVEVTKLSLLLKVLEGEDEQTIARQFALFHKRVLPDLGNNIKCGNSLIGPDFYDGQQMTFLNQEEMYRINAFDWQAEFPEIMKNGGFDAVIGNPPYVRPHKLSKEIKELLWSTFSTFEAKSDLYSCFMERGLSLTRPQGLFGFIVPHTWTSLESFTKIRDFILQNSLVYKLVQLPKKVFIDATVETCIFVFKRISKGLNKVCNQVVVERLEPNRDIHFVRKFFQKDIQDAYLYNFQLYSRNESQTIIQKIKKCGRGLVEYVSFVYGFKTADDQKFIHETKKYNESKAFIRSAAIRRYWNSTPCEYVWYVPDQMRRNKKTARPGEAERFEAEKIMVARMGKSIVANYDPGGLYVKDAMLLLNASANPYSLKYLLGIINSRLLTYFYREFFVTIDVLKNALLNLPIRTIDFSNPNDKARHDQIVGLVERVLDLNKQLAEAKLPQAKTVLQRQIEATDRQIDELVYELYGLTDEEIRIVEKSLQ